MKFDRNSERQTQRIDQQKANRPKVVSEAPEHGRNGDTVAVMDDDGVSDVLLRVEGEWISLFNEDGFEVDAVPVENATRGVRKCVNYRYTIGGHPRSRPTKFNVEFIGAAAAGVSDIELTPERPSRDAGAHILRICFTPSTNGNININLTLS